MFEGVDDILKELSPEQQAACTAPNNVLLTACPGSGKCCFAQRMRKSRKKNENFTSLSYNKKKNMKKRLQRLTACKMKGPCCKKAAGVVLCKQSFSRDKKAV